MLILMGITALLYLTGCSAEPQPIHYGTDVCAFCEMTIVDRQHASEMVTEKGKVYKYDSIECMLRDRKNHTDVPVALYLIDDFAHAGILTDARNATYLISENFPSPMGANLSGFASRDEAEKVMKSEGGRLFTWQEIGAQIK
ncbi:MAG: hypothetical protein D6677_01125 [Calditrichaeota bacterium]|nr:MAG: hypothetical protein D6677_01125 [Calditrichota bacterium]